MLESIYSNPLFSQSWDDTTLLLYIFIVFCAFLGGFFSQHSLVLITRPNDIVLTKNVLNFKYVVFVFLILFGFSAFRNIGSDYPTYKEIFNSANTSDILNFSIEPGFVIYNKFFRLFTNSSFLFFAITSFITTYLVFSTIIRYSNHINLSIAFGAYASIFYFQSYSLMRIYLASAFILYSFRFLYEKRFVIYIICILFAITIHASSFFIFYSLLLLYVYRKNHIAFYLVLILTLFACYNFSDYLMFFNISTRYNQYLENINGKPSLGFGQVAINAPLLIILAHARKLKLNTWILDLSTVFIYSNFLFGILGYWIPGIGRACIHFSYPFILFLPYYLKEIKHTKNYSIIYVFIIIYILFRLHLYFSDYLYSDDIMPYKSIFSN